jgi:H+-transporting ATPase
MPTIMMVSQVYVGFVWVYCLVWVFVEDCAKLHVYRHMEMGTKGQRKFWELIQKPLHPHKI